MFDDVEQIGDMTYQEYKKAVYYFNHPDEYDGDFISFRDKVIEFASRKDMICYGCTKRTEEQ